MCSLHVSFVSQSLIAGMFSLFDNFCFFGFSSSDLAGPDERRLIAEGFDFLLFFK